MDSCSSICICRPCNIIIRYRNLIVLETALTIHVAVVSGASFVTPAAYMDVVTPAAFRVAPVDHTRLIINTDGDAMTLKAVGNNLTSLPGTMVAIMHYCFL
jgi:hypothetical protein